MFLAVPCSASAEITRPRVVRDLANTQTHQGQRISILFHVSAEELVTLSLLLWCVCASLCVRTLQIKQIHIVLYYALGESKVAAVRLDTLVNTVGWHQILTNHT